MKNKHKFSAVLVAGVALALTSHPAAAHHGRDFLLLETDDMPAKGESYAVLAVDTIRNADGERATEITPGLVLRAGNRFVVEPHFHVTRETGENFRYEATAASVRYRIGDLGHSGWRGAIGAEVEIPRHRSDEPSNGEFSLVATRTFSRALVAVNLLYGHELTAGGESDYAIGAGILTPLSNGDQIGVESIVSLPTHDGIEILPSYSHRLGNKTQLKVGVGVFHATGFTSGTFHAQLVQRF